MVFYYNADASHKEWMEAVAQSVKNTLGIDARAEGVPTFAVFRQQINAHQMNGPYRAGWQQDYPDVENWIGPLYVTGGSSNDGLYSNPEVDALYKEGTAAATSSRARQVRRGDEADRPGRSVDPDLLLQPAVRVLRARSRTSRSPMSARSTCPRSRLSLSRPPSRVRPPPLVGRT